MPRHLLIVVERNLVQSITPGTRVKVMGTYSLGPSGGKGAKERGGGGGVSISQPYLKVVGLAQESEGARGNAHFTDAEHTEFKAFAARPFKEVIKDIRSRIAPAIFGSDDVKAAVASLLFSGARKTTRDGARLRYVAHHASFTRPSIGLFQHSFYRVGPWVGPFLSTN